MGYQIRHPEDLRAEIVSVARAASTFAGLITVLRDLT